jgi:hypothetical protein
VFLDVVFVAAAAVVVVLVVVVVVVVVIVVVVAAAVAVVVVVVVYVFVVGCFVVAAAAVVVGRLLWLKLLLFSLSRLCGCRQYQQLLVRVTPQQSGLLLQGTKSDGQIRKIDR